MNQIKEQINSPILPIWNIKIGHIISLNLHIRIFAKMASLANMRLAHINSPQSDHCRQPHQLMSPNITSCMSESDDINSNDLTSAHII